MCSADSIRAHSTADDNFIGVVSACHRFTTLDTQSDYVGPFKYLRQILAHGIFYLTGVRASII